MKNTPTRRCSLVALVDRGFEQREEVAAVGEARQGIEFSQFLQLEGAFGHFGFEEMCLVAGSGLGHGELGGHVIESEGKGVELADATAGHGDACFAFGDSGAGA